MCTQKCLAVTLVIVCAGGGSAALGATTTWLYWTDGDFTVRRASVDGSILEVFAYSTDTTRDFDGIAVDRVNGRVYWTDYDTPSTIWSAKLDGSAVNHSIAGVYHGLALDVPGNYMYWMSKSYVARSPLQGPYTAPDYYLHVPPSQRAGEFIGLALDTVNGSMYWTDANSGGSNPGGTIWRADLNGSNLEKVMDTPMHPFGISLDIAANHMFYAQSRSGIWRANLDGSNAVLLVSESSVWEFDLDLDNGHIYFGDGDGISRANLDGTAVTQVISGIGRVRGLALGPYIELIGDLPPVPNVGGSGGIIPEPSTFAALVGLGLMGAMTSVWRPQARVGRK